MADLTTEAGLRSWATELQRIMKTIYAGSPHDHATAAHWRRDNLIDELMAADLLGAQGCTTPPSPVTTEPRCPWCGGLVEMNVSLGDGFWASCLNEDCLARGPLRPDPASALAAMADVGRPMVPDIETIARTVNRAFWTRTYGTETGTIERLTSAYWEGDTDIAQAVVAMLASSPATPTGGQS